MPSLESGKVGIVFQTMLESHPELKHVPLAVKYAKTDEARELLKITNRPYGILAPPYTVPPNTPKERLETLQKAFIATTKDPELLAEAKQAKLEFTPVDGPTVTKMVSDLYELKPEVKATLKKICQKSNSLPPRAGAVAPSFCGAYKGGMWK